MRGRRTFRKLIDKTPSGSYVWRVVDFFGNQIEGGRDRQLTIARQHARECEQRAFRLLTR